MEIEYSDFPVVPTYYLKLHSPQLLSSYIHRRRPVQIFSFDPVVLESIFAIVRDPWRKNEQRAFEPIMLEPVAGK